APAAAPADGAAAPAATPEAPGAAPATPPADGAAATPAEAPAKPAPAAPAGPVAGDGTVRISVAVGSDASITEWRDHTGTGLNRRLSKAVSYIAADKDLRDGGLVPVTVTVEVSGGTALETIAKLNSIDVQVLTENAPLPAPVTEAPAAPSADAPAAEAPAATPAPATDAPATAPAAPPATNP
ncbi:MAG: hypothetical protein KJS87_08245, partial [Alphaproteobacteria bacterium]|nr:hypothetical protein [Alphaproteobacteria bacterium]